MELTFEFDLEFDLDMVKMNLQAKYLGQGSVPCVPSGTHTHTHTHTPGRLLYLDH